MGISAFISKVCVQTAVYWNPTGSDGFGGYTFDASEISCRWDGLSEMIMNKEGREIVSNAKIMVTTDLDVEGYLYLGSLTDLTYDQIQDPRKVSGAYQIQKIERVPLFKSTDEFVRTIYL